MSEISPAQLIVESLSFVRDNAAQFVNEYQVNIEEDDFRKAANLLMDLATSFQENYTELCEDNLRGYHPDCTDIFDGQDNLVASYEMTSLLTEEGLSDCDYDDENSSIENISTNHKSTYTNQDVEEPLP